MADDPTAGQGTVTPAATPPPVTESGLPTSLPPANDPPSDPAAPVAVSADPVLGVPPPGAVPTPVNVLGTPPSDPAAPSSPEATPSATLAPDSYTPFENAPEGFNMDKATTDLFKNANLTQEGAQVLVAGLKERGEAQALLAKQQNINEYNENMTLLKQDFKFGGMHFDKTIADATLGLNRVNQMLGNNKLSELLTAANIQSHPEVVKLFTMIENWHGEKSFITGETNGVDPGGKDPLTNLNYIIGKEIKELGLNG